MPQINKSVLFYLKAVGDSRHLYSVRQFLSGAFYMRDSSTLYSKTLNIFAHIFMVLYLVYATDVHCIEINKKIYAKTTVQCTVELNTT